jgi:uncharacterized heparinase superfamily protein
MRGLTLSERFRVRALSVEQARRRIVTRTLSSPLLRWRYGTGAADQILIVPQDLRPPDPSFWNEVEHGHFGLACEVADLKGASPFRVPPVSLAWARDLHGFGWLRHFAATEEEDAYLGARQLVLDWISVQKMPAGIAYEPAVTARRLMSWIAQANMLLEGTDAKTYTRILSSVGDQVVTLNATWRNAPEGVPRLLALIALVLCNLAVSGYDRKVKESEAALLEELRRQILEDGGHISRNTATLSDLVLDILPLSQCFVARGFAAPDELTALVKKALAFLRFMRLGDGMLARFNGVSTGSPATLATVLGYSEGDLQAAAAAESSGYVRLERGTSIIIADAGSPPPLEIAAEAQAGCLSFEMSSGDQLVLANGGFPGPADHDWDAVARATASHNTLCLNETSSSELVRHEQLQKMTGGLPIRGPDLAVARLSDEGGTAVLAASHDGYQGRYGLMHSRRLALSPQGDRLDGLDRLEPPTGRLRLKADLPFSIHFHLHPESRCVKGEKHGSARITLSDGQVWLFSSDGAELSLEESLFFVDSAGPRPAMQLVLRASTFGDSEVRWSLRAEPWDATAAAFDAA